ncbi:hypothetical protein ACLINW_004543 [Vibrio parahaemolyticus]|uniref:hypothetical protein n=1 Tax=Vibrio parahaemolyticus TaxID=670 RepID=UPI001DBB60FA|nr:hypothetical protein [Vibrio parahaemolyticus]EJG1726482.1 hypothetical protein [Vibrio parahaemolyticus]EJG1740180.1 hypothetical protein [Vibrio parahaemolyticus]EJG1754343.1 hypothetical protein [Vibrio parahaemolyticus]EJG1758891.1 hypothetical protein [Vibrio parahaemolyticus]UYW16419.1 hypothetical protein IF561_04240 [Vibrio parahaemolyticus]
MISNKTKIEKSSSRIVTNSSFNKIEISFDASRTPKEVWSFMKECLSTKSEANIVKQVLLLLSGNLVSSNKSYFDQLRFDQISKVVADNSSTKLDIGKEGFISVKIPKWQVVLVASSLPQCQSSSEFIELCLEKSYKKLKSSFSDGGL